MVIKFIRSTTAVVPDATKRTCCDSSCQFKSPHLYLFCFLQQLINYTFTRGERSANLRHRTILHVFHWIRRHAATWQKNRQAEHPVAKQRVAAFTLHRLTDRHILKISLSHKRVKLSSNLRCRTNN